MVYFGAIRDTNRRIRRAEQLTRSLHDLSVEAQYTGYTEGTLGEEAFDATELEVLERLQKRCRRSKHGEETRNRWMRRTARLETLREAQYNG